MTRETYIKVLLGLCIFSAIISFTSPLIIGYLPDSIQPGYAATAQLLFLVLIFLGFFLLKALGNGAKNYIDEKSKGLAKKEDLGELTQIVEKVKQEFIHSNEELKAQLSVRASSAISLKDEERQAVIDLNRAFYKWFSLIKKPINAATQAKVNEDIIEINNAFEQMVYSEANLKLFVGDSIVFREYLKLKQNILENIYNFRGKIIVEVVKALSGQRENTTTNVEHNIKIYIKAGEATKVYDTHVLQILSNYEAQEIEFQSKCRKFLYA